MKDTINRQLPHRLSYTAYPPHPAEQPDAHNPASAPRMRVVAPLPHPQPAVRGRVSELPPAWIQDRAVSPAKNMPPAWIQDQAATPFDRSSKSAQTPPKWVQEQAARRKQPEPTTKSHDGREEFFQGNDDQHDILYRMVTAIEANQVGICVPLIVGSVCLLYMYGNQPKPVHTIALQPTTSEQSPRYVDFTSQQFQANLAVEDAYAVETNRGHTLGLRPMTYPLTVPKQVLGVSVGSTTMPVEVVEFWVEGKKRGYFDFYQKKYISIDPNFDSLASLGIDLGDSGS